MKSSSRIALVLICGAGMVATIIPRSASAQIVTTITPPRPARERGQVATAADSVRRADSIRFATRLERMKAWVDSAAVAIAASPAVPAGDSAVAAAAVSDSQLVTDTAMAARTPPRSPAAADSAAGDTVAVLVDGQVAPEQAASVDSAAVREGAPAPDTATHLPLLLLVAAASTIAGALLRRRR